MPEALQLWHSMRGPESRWRQEARAVMIRVVREQRDAGLLNDDVALLRAVDAAYPFGEREHLPYKMWLLERKLFRDACTVPAATPTADEVGVCEVASDLVQLGRFDEARKLLEEQAPNRLGRTCPACGSAPGRHCVELHPDASFIALDHPTTHRRSVSQLIVPHYARLVGHRDAGPLFGGAP